MSAPTVRIVVDIGNSRMKWGVVDLRGGLLQTIALPTDDMNAWARTWSSWVPDSAPGPEVAVSTVNPPVASDLERFFASREPGSRPSREHWYRSAAAVPVSHGLAKPERTGADRALAVLAARTSLTEEESGLVVSCGTAITVERIGRDRVWQGGVIAVGLGLAARALNQNTAQLPLVEPGQFPVTWGDSTHPALEAGIFWGTVGGVREILARQMADLPGSPSIIWTGGDAEPIAQAVSGPGAIIVPHLVLDGLILASNWRRSD